MRSCFAGEARHPERVNDVDAFELEADVAPDRNMDFVRGLEALRPAPRRDIRHPTTTAARELL